MLFHRICVNYNIHVKKLKSISSSYVQNMIENMILTSYSDNSYFIAKQGGYVASIHMMSPDKLKHKVMQQFLSPDKFSLLRDITFMSYWRLHYTMTGKQVMLQ